VQIRLLAALFPLLLVAAARPVYACTYSIPVVGRWQSLQVGLDIPPAPLWARDLILNASRVWNFAQLWFQRIYSPGGSVYRFVDSSTGNVTISFGVPAAFASIAVGWTEYAFEGATTIVGAHVFLDGNVFGDVGEPNASALDFGFRIALHELGRVLGLGSLIDGLDIMDPVGTVNAAAQPPLISLIDLFALHVLASEPSLPSSTIVLNTDQQVVLNAWTLLAQTRPTEITAASNGPPIGTNKPCLIDSVKHATCYS